MTAIVRLRALWVVALLGLAGSLASQTDADWQWMDENYGHALDAVMPMNPPGGMYVAYRSHRDLYTQELEYSFRLGDFPKPDGPGLNRYLSAEIRIADSVSLYDQMMALHRKDPAATPEKLEKQLRYKRWYLMEKTCPGLKSEYEKLHKMHWNISPPLPSQEVAIILHPLIEGFHMVATEGDAWLTIGDERHPLSKWAAETRSALDACTAVTPPSLPPAADH